MTVSPDLSDHALAAALAEASGELLLELRKRAGELDPKELRAEGDRQSHELLMAELARTRPDDAVLSEEGKDSSARLSADRVWIVDPLDGTREYGEEGRSDWAVHVALWVGGELVAGAVALPAQGQTLNTESAPKVAAAIDGPPRLLVSRTRPPTFVDAVRERIDGTLVPLGSAGAKAMAVVQGEADIYLHAGGQYEWDSAAPVVVASAAGLHCSRIDGSKLAYNQPDPLLPDLLICRPELAKSVLDAVAAVEPTG